MNCPTCRNGELKSKGTIKVYTDTPLGANDYVLTAWECCSCKMVVYT